jgi:hypothetical protein
LCRAQYPRRFKLASSSEFAQAQPSLDPISNQPLAGLQCNLWFGCEPDVLRDTGFGSTRVVFSPGSGQVQLPRYRQAALFREAWKAAGEEAEPSHPAFEGYINARVFVEALRTAGRTPARENFIAATWKLTRDLGGFNDALTSPGAMPLSTSSSPLGPDGRFIR